MYNKTVSKSWSVGKPWIWIEKQRKKVFSGKKMKKMTNYLKNEKKWRCSEKMKKMNKMTHLTAWNNTHFAFTGIFPI